MRGLPSPTNVRLLTLYIMPVRMIKQLVSELTKVRERLENRETFGAVLIVAMGLLARLWATTGTYLDPDEALCYMQANQTSLPLAYKASLNVVHPPLLIFGLYYIRHLGTSELILRLPSVIAGTAFCWVAYKWVARLLGRTAGWIGLIFFAFLPPLIEFSAEVRQYALLLLFAACTLYFLERALVEGSVGMMLLSLTFLYLAMLSHYSAILFAAAVGGYALVRIASQRPLVRLTVSWVIGQMGVLGLSLVFYVTHISRLAGNGREQSFLAWMRTSYIPNFYFKPGQDNVLLFLVSRMHTVFQYVFGQSLVGSLAFLLFVASLVLLCRKSFKPDSVPIDGRLTALFLVLPFAITGGAALARSYPFGGTRQCMFLAIFAISGVSLVLSKAVGQRIVYGVAVAVVLVLICNVFGRPRQPYMRRANRHSDQMERAMEFVREHIPRAEPIFTDYQSGILVGHYLCHQGPVPRWSVAPGFELRECDNHRITSPVEIWMFTLDAFLRNWDPFVRAYKLRAGDRVWVVEQGVNLATQLREHFPEFHQLQPSSFGRNIEVFELTVCRSPISATSPGRPPFRPPNLCVE